MKNVQDIYPATPMQELMLLHTLSQRAKDTLLTQFVFAIEGDVDAQALEGAWQAVVERHAMLRTAFVTQKTGRPLQVVRQQVTLPFEVLDYRLDAKAEDTFIELCRNDRTLGIDPARAPLMRFFLVRMDQANWRLVWTSHHLLMDRWCLNELFSDLGTAYASLRAGARPNLQGAPAFRQYVDWLAQQDQNKADAYWRSELSGFETATPLASSGPAASVPNAAKFSLPAEVCTKIDAAARRFAVSKGTLVQAALAITMAEHSGRGDVVFGVAAAARPPAIPNVERIVGSFVNNLPLRVRCQRPTAVAIWLKGLQQAAFERSDFEYVSPVRIAEAADLPEGSALFDTLLVWLAPTTQRLPLGMTPLSDDMATAYPVTLSVAESPLGLTFHIHQRANDPEHAATVLQRMRHHLLSVIEASAEATLADLLPSNVPDVERRSATVAAPIMSPATAAEEHSAQGRESIPESLLRQLIAHQFAAVLELDEVAHDADFFELGGNSLRAAQLHAQLSQGTRKNLPLLALFREPTIDGLTRTLHEQDWPSRRGMVLPLRSSGHGPTLFCVASPEVNTLGYFVLSRRLPGHINSAVLQAPPLTDQPQPMDPDIIEPMARNYVQALREQQPRGPYQLLGMCGGAHLAMAMARQLHSEGETIGFFGVVNTWSLYSVSRVYYLHRARRILAYYRRRIGALMGFKPTPPAALDVPVADAPQVDPANEDVGLDNPWIRDVGFAHRNPGAPKLPIRAHVLRLERQQYWRTGDADLGWSTFFERSTHHLLPGRFHSNLMREPFVKDLVLTLAPLIDADPASDADSASPRLTKTTTELCS